MRKIVFAFNVVSTLYACIFALTLMVAIAGSQVFLADSGVSILAILAVFGLFSLNLLATYGLKRLQLWGYFLGVAHLIIIALFITVDLISSESKGFLGSALLYWLIFSLGVGLYNDFKTEMVETA